MTVLNIVFYVGMRSLKQNQRKYKSHESLVTILSKSPNNKEG